MPSVPLSLHGQPALSGFDLEIRPGELVALVGDNGAGKTSVVNLLLRLYDPLEGCVRLGGGMCGSQTPGHSGRASEVLFQRGGRYVRLFELQAAGCR